MKIVVIGGGAAGMAAATRAKRVNPSAGVLILEAGREFARGTCSLPYLLSREISNPALLQGISPAELENRGIELRLETAAVRIRPLERRVDTTGETVTYDKLIVGLGSRPISGKPLGFDPQHPRVWRLRTLTDVDKIDSVLGREEIARVAVIGGGYVGIEFAEALHRRGLTVTLFHQHEELMKLDPRLSSQVASLLERQGIELKLGQRVTGVKMDPRGGRLTTQDGEHSFHAFALALGVEPVTDILKQAGARTGVSGAVQVTSRGETTLSNVYACGDGVEIPDREGGQPRWIPLATTAARMGRVCGENAAGGSARLAANRGSLAVRLFDQQLGLVGQPRDWTESRSFKFQWGSIHTPFPRRRPGEGLFFFDPRTERVKGLQALGPEVVPLVDLVSLAVEKEMTVTEFQEQDFCYNPPLGSLWHPLYLASRLKSREESHGFQGFSS
jgi:NADPH-dependent 2,4-dienoyl-CoA reductase/sulfur reductase-like enzyme